MIYIKLFGEVKRANEKAAIKIAPRFQILVKMVVMTITCLMSTSHHWKASLINNLYEERYRIAKWPLKRDSRNTL